MNQFKRRGLRWYWCRRTAAEAMLTASGCSWLGKGETCATDCCCTHARRRRARLDPRGGGAAVATGPVPNRRLMRARRPELSARSERDRGTAALSEALGGWQRWPVSPRDVGEQPRNAAVGHGTLRSPPPVERPGGRHDRAADVLDVRRRRGQRARQRPPVQG